MSLPTVFLIDYDEEDRLLFSTAFQRVDSSVDIRCFSSGSHALAHLTKVEVQPVRALVVLDVLLPDGDEVIETMAKHPHLGFLPIAVLCSEYHPKREEYMGRTSVRAVYNKPSSYHQLLNLARQLLELARGQDH